MSEPLTLSIRELMALLRMGVAGLRRSRDAEAYMVRTHQHCITEPHWYLWVLGVDPARQGQGIGGLLLRAGLARADASDLPCYLETMNPKNVPLYQKFGFAVESIGTLPGSSVRMWSMIRPAHSAPGIR
jgi:ribosomal protein S18 acetylase RimI-like enzyme